MKLVSILKNTRAFSSTTTNALFNPTSEILQLREVTRAFAQDKVLPGARERDAQEKFDMGLFKQCGELGLLGVT